MWCRLGHCLQRLPLQIMPQLRWHETLLVWMSSPDSLLCPPANFDGGARGQHVGKFGWRGYAWTQSGVAQVCALVKSSGDRRPTIKFGTIVL